MQPILNCSIMIYQFGDLLEEVGRIGVAQGWDIFVVGISKRCLRGRSSRTR